MLVVVLSSLSVWISRIKSQYWNVSKTLVGFPKALFCSLWRILRLPAELLTHSQVFPGVVVLHNEVRFPFSGYRKSPKYFHETLLNKVMVPFPGYRIFSQVLFNFKRKLPTGLSEVLQT